MRRHDATASLTSSSSTRNDPQPNPNPGRGKYSGIRGLITRSRYRRRHRASRDRCVSDPILPSPLPSRSGVRAAATTNANANDDDRESSDARRPCRVWRAQSDAGATVLSPSPPLPQPLLRTLRPSSASFAQSPPLAPSPSAASPSARWADTLYGWYRIPEAVRCAILSFLDIADLARLSETSISSMVLARSDAVWRSRYASRFKDAEVKTAATSANAPLVDTRMSSSAYHRYRHRHLFPAPGDSVHVVWVGAFNLVDQERVRSYRGRSW